MSAIQRLDAVALERLVTVPIWEGYSPTLEMTSNVMENGRVPVYVQGFDTLVFFILPDLVFEEMCKVRGCYQILAYTSSTEQKLRTIRLDGSTGEPEQFCTNLNWVDLF